ncbi:MAG: hypothetical protein EOP51_10405 [Sphingobacteriales bacterium]|nr:MAG: hypothetical protein EOP51_10405 [Sphingobacteriales bacterium]
MLLIRYNEPLEAEEIAFLQRKETRERRQFYKVIRVLMILCFVCPFIVAWFRAADGAENPFSYQAYFIGVVFLLCFAGTGVYIAYRRSLYQLHADLRNLTKTVECTHITRKQFMPHNNTFYFYLDSPNKLSIEVSEADFRSMEAGDELNIEYTTYSRQYLGYF